MKYIRNLFGKSKRVADSISETLITSIEEGFQDWLDEQAEPYERDFEETFDDPTDLAGDTFSTYLNKYYSVISNYAGRRKGSRIEVFDYVVGFRYNKFCLSVILRRIPENPEKPVILISLRKQGDKLDVKKLKAYLDAGRIKSNLGWKLFSSSPEGRRLLNTWERDIDDWADDFRQEIEEM
jgi:hypothetical protein